MKWHKIDLAEIEGDHIFQTTVSDKKICIVRTSGKTYAVQNNCPHAGGILSGGWCKDGNIVCPIHRWEYNLETGRGAEGQGDYIKTYPVEIRDDGIYIGIKENLWQRFFR